MTVRILIAGLVVLAGSARAELWNVEELSRAPKAEWCEGTGGVRQVYFEGVAWSGKPTRVYAMVGLPTNASAGAKVPGVVLVHGGGGKVFPDWVKHWTKRGYAAIAMDTAGHGPSGRLADGGPDQSDVTKFRNFDGDDAKNMWTYHAIADVLLSHSLLRSLPEVDAERTALTGISWGGYLTCIAAGVDQRFKCAVPVYGCGFLHENSTWLPSQLKPMKEDRRARWVENFDPSSHIGKTTYPLLFLTGTCDFAYPMDSLQKTYGLVKSPVTLSVEINRPHGHIWRFPEVDAFIDSHLRGGDPLQKVGPLKIADGVATADWEEVVPFTKAELNYTADTGNWQKRKWVSVPAGCVTAGVGASTIFAPLPTNRPLVAYLRVADSRTNWVSTAHVELP